MKRGCLKRGGPKRGVRRYFCTRPLVGPELSARAGEELVNRPLLEAALRLVAQGLRFKRGRSLHEREDLIRLLLRALAAELVGVVGLEAERNAEGFGDGYHRAEPGV